MRQSGLGEGAQQTEVSPPHRSISPRNNIRTQPGHMIRSNSSGGFQHHHHPPSSPRNRNVMRNNSVETSRATQPSLADLEFPPPPPPEDLDYEKQNVISTDVSNAQPSVEEASFRFGVSLRHREPSTDSCSSAKSEPVRPPSKTSPRPRDRPPSPPSQTPSQETKTPSPASEEQPSSPPSPPSSPKGNKDESVSPERDPDKKSSSSKLLKNALPGMMKEMLELKLAAENKEKAAKGKESPQSDFGDSGENSEHQTSPVDFKANLRKVSLASDGSNKQESSFKAQLKKFEMKRDSEDRGNGGIGDLKSRLRKVDGSGKPEPEEEESDDKRRSTGSISSLKKLWEGESSPPEVLKERRVWPPEEKPAVPTKPTVKPVAKAAAIYATPGILASVLEIWQALETSLATLKSSPSVTSASWLQLSDKVGLFHSSCLGYADSVAPPHARFHLRELLTRLEVQARTLRSAGARNQADNTKTLTDLHNTLKDVINAVQR